MNNSDGAATAPTQLVDDDHSQDGSQTVLAPFPPDAWAPAAEARRSAQQWPPSSSANAGVVQGGHGQVFGGGTVNCGGHASATGYDGAWQLYGQAHGGTASAQVPIVAKDGGFVASSPSLVGSAPLTDDARMAPSEAASTLPSTPSTVTPIRKSVRKTAARRSKRERRGDVVIAPDDDDCLSECTDHGDSESVSRVELDELLGKLKVDVVRDASTKFAEVFGEKISSTLKAFDNINQKRFSSIESELEAVKREQRAFAATNKEMQEAIAKLQKETAVADSRVAPQPVYDASFDKAPEPEVININTSAAVDLATLEGYIRQWLSTQTELNEHWDLFAMGRPVKGAHKRFHLRFRGDGTVGARRAALFLALPRSHGVWSPVYMQHQNQQVQLFLSEDKSRRTIKAERALRQLRRILIEETGITEERVWLNKQDFEIVADGRRLLRVDPGDAARTPVELDWKEKFAGSLHIDMDRVAKRFREGEFRRRMDSDDEDWARAHSKL